MDGNSPNLHKINKNAGVSKELLEKRQRNSEAARRCRDKIKNKIEQLEKENQELLEQKRDLYLRFVQSETMLKTSEENLAKANERNNMLEARLAQFQKFILYTATQGKMGESEIAPYFTLLIQVIREQVWFALMQKNAIKTYSNKLFRNKELELERLRKWEIIKSMSKSKASGSSLEMDVKVANSEPDKENTLRQRTSISDDYLMIEKDSHATADMNETKQPRESQDSIQQGMSFEDLKELTDHLVDKVQSIDIANDDTLSATSEKEKEDLDYVNIRSRQAPFLKEKNISDLLKLCKQDRFFTFEEFFKNQLPTRKIGEATYSDVYLIPGKYTPQIAVKVIPIGGQDQLTVSSAWLEIKVSELISSVLQRDGQQHAVHFAKLERVGLVRGLYHSKLLDIWNDYNDQVDSENVPPDEYPEDQEYLIMYMEYGGKDLEHSEIITNEKRVFSAFLQIVLSLAQAEQQLSFEHRDLHWGNVLVSSWKQSFLTFKIPLDGTTYSIVVPTASIKVTLIDFALSKLVDGEQLYYNDLELDPDLFTGKGVDKKGDLQFDIYRWMRQELESDWSSTSFKTNIFWVYYLADKLNQICPTEMGDFKAKILDYPSVSELVRDHVLNPEGYLFKMVHKLLNDLQGGVKAEIEAKPQVNLLQEIEEMANQFQGMKKPSSPALSKLNSRSVLKGSPDIIPKYRTQSSASTDSKEGREFKTCSQCLEPITSGGQVLGNKYFHSEHFNCNKCKKHLRGLLTFDRDGLLWCEKDYHQTFSPQCGYCKEPVKEEGIEALGMTFHEDHFFCAMCGKNLIKTSFIEYQGKAFCQDDYNTFFATRCVGCMQPLLDDYVTVQSKNYHINCLVCTVCQKVISATSLYTHEDQHYCEYHYYELTSNICYDCKGIIIGRCVVALDKKFHLNHFKCAFCSKNLDEKGGYKEKSNKAYCTSCYVKIFN